jgi:hypothetical protein
MPTKKLDQDFVNAPELTGNRIIYWDAKLPGFGLVVRPTAPSATCGPTARTVWTLAVDIPTQANVPRLRKRYSGEKRLPPPFADGG